MGLNKYEWTGILWWYFNKVCSLPKNANDYRAHTTYKSVLNWLTCSPMKQGLLLSLQIRKLRYTNVRNSPKAMQLVGGEAKTLTQEGPHHGQAGQPLWLTGLGRTVWCWVLFGFFSYLITHIRNNKISPFNEIYCKVILYEPYGKQTLPVTSVFPSGVRIWDDSRLYLTIASFQSSWFWKRCPWEHFVLIRVFS